MRMIHVRAVLAVASAFVIAGVACSNDTTESPAASSGSSGTGVCASYDTSAGDALAAICSSGKLRVATDQKYKPQSWLDAKTGEWMGFDVDVAKEIAARLGVEADINHQDWEVITAGSWNDRWDVSVGSMTVTLDREKLFYFTPAYYYTPAIIAVHKDNTSIQDLNTDLDGKKVCVGVSTTYESYLEGTLRLPEIAPPYDFVVDNAQVITYTTDTDALDQLALGDGARCDAAMSSSTTIQGYIDDGGPIKIVGDPLYYEPLAIAFDRKDPSDNASLTEAVGKIIDDMHADGTLSSLSNQWFHVDLSIVFPANLQG
jgi:polar amino acid transport system substrate-binding protein